MNGYELVQGGDYVVFVNYTVAGVSKSVSMAVTIGVAEEPEEPVIAPEITVVDGKFVVDMNGTEYVRSYVFYLSDTEGVDLTDWNAVKAAAKEQRATSPYDTTTTNGFMTYSKQTSMEKMTLPTEAGTYVLFVTYSDAEAANLQVSAVLVKG